MLERLKEVCYQATCSAASDPFIRYTYDVVGNRLSEERTGATTTYDHDAADQLVSSTTGGVTTTYEHDVNGNMTKAGSRVFGYDLANRMISTTQGGSTITYEYDGAGRRLKAIAGVSPSDVTKYLWDSNMPLAQLALEHDGNNGLVRRYEHGLDLVSTTTGAGDSYYHHDALGSVISVTDSAGSPQWAYTYDPFGSTKTVTKVDPAAAYNPVRFAGEYVDPTGLYHLRARQYDAELGRFTSQDPIPQKIMSPPVSTYAYANNVPTSMVDPAGLEARGDNPPEAYWNIRSHQDFWDEHAQAGLENPNAVMGFLEWAGGKTFGGLLGGSGLDTVQASAETLGTACTSGYDKFMSGLSIAGVGASWYGGGTATSSRVGWSSSLFGRGGPVAKTGSTFKGILNRNSVRIGWGYHNGRVFRIGIGSGKGRIHIDLWR